MNRQPCRLLSSFGLQRLFDMMTTTTQRRSKRFPLPKDTTHPPESFVSSGPDYRYCRSFRAKHTVGAPQLSQKLIFGSWNRSARLLECQSSGTNAPLHFAPVQVLPDDHVGPRIASTRNLRSWAQDCWEIGAGRGSLFFGDPIFPMLCGNFPSSISSASGEGPVLA